MPFIKPNIFSGKRCSYKEDKLLFPQGLVLKGQELEKELEEANKLIG